MGKKSPEPAKPYQGPQFGMQENLLSNAVMGQMMAANPSLMGAMGVGGQAGKTGYGSANPFGYGGKGGISNAVASIGNINAFKPQGFQQAGQAIAGQIMPNTTFSQPQNTTSASMKYNPYQFQMPNVNFQQRNPYQFQGYDMPEIQGVNVGDMFTPNMNLATRAIEDQRGKSYEQMLSDMNSRGMLTSGAATKANFLNNQEFDRQLANSGDQFAIAQTQAQLQEDQMRRQMEQQRQTQMATMDQQRQIEQAAEIFRQQGASDEQARFLAEQGLNVQGQQAAQNLSGFQANLGSQEQAYQQALARATLGMQQQGQAFDQRLAGRQQGTAEEQLANLMRRQPLEDLFKLYGMQTGMIGPTEGSSGIMGIFGPLFGAGLSGVGGWSRSNRAANSAANSIAGAAGAI